MGVQPGSKATNSDKKATKPLLFGHCDLGGAELSSFGSCKNALWCSIAASKHMKESLLFQSMRILLVVDYLIRKENEVEI